MPGTHFKFGTWESKTQKPWNAPKASIWNFLKVNRFKGAFSKSLVVHKLRQGRKQISTWTHKHFLKMFSIDTESQLFWNEVWTFNVDS